MEGKAHVFRPWEEPEVQLLTEPPDLEFIKGLVKGWIEAVPCFDTIDLDGEVVPCVAFCNEEGKLQGLAMNGSATALWDAAMRRLIREGTAVYPTGLIGPDGNMTDVLCGPIVVFTGDDEFMDSL